MPEQGVDLLPRQELLSFEEIEKLVRVFAGLGVRRVRLTGGEPTMRRDVVGLVSRLARVDGIDSVVMTTNGHRLPELAEALARAGLAEVNVSLDTLDDDRFRALTRRGDLQRVISGIEAAARAGMKVKLNTVALRGDNEGELAALCRFALERGAVPRFIEHMPLSDGALYRSLNHLGAAEIRERIAQEMGDRLESEGSGCASGPARYWHLASRPSHRFGIISAMSEHFCADCNRVRLSAIGDLHTCLAYDDATPLRQMLREGATDQAIRDTITRAVQAKRDGHEFSLAGDGAPGKHMVSIGG